MAEDKGSASFLSQLQKRSRNINKKLNNIKSKEVQSRQSDADPTEETKAMFATKIPNTFYLAETNKIIEMYQEWEAGEAQNSQKANLAQGKAVRFLGKLLALADALDTEALTTLKTENPEEAENLTYVRKFLNGYFPTSEVAFSEINRIRAEFTQMVLAGSYGEQWDRKRLESSAESVYKLVKDLPATNVPVAVFEETKQEQKPAKQEREPRGNRRGGRDNRGGRGKNRQPVQEREKEPEKPAEPEPAASAKDPEPEEVKAPAPPKRNPTPPEEPASGTWADQDDEGDEEEDDVWESVGAKSSGYKKKAQEQAERQRENQRGQRRGGRRGDRDRGRRGRGDRRR